MKFDSVSIEKQLVELDGRRERSLPSSQRELILASEANARSSLLVALQTARLVEAVVTLTERLETAHIASQDVLEGVKKELTALRLQRGGNSSTTFEDGGGI